MSWPGTDFECEIQDRLDTQEAEIARLQALIPTCTRRPKACDAEIEALRKRLEGVPEAFTGFPKIPRLRREIIVTEKIDGTNASIFVPEDGGPLLAGSRTRWITPDHDNYGFARWVADHEERLRVALGPGRYFGEWWGPGIQRRYNIPEKRFSLFREAPADLCHVVPVLYRGQCTDSAIESVLAFLRSVGSIAAPGFMNPEGIVVQHTASQHLYKVTLDKDEAKTCRL